MVRIITRHSAKPRRTTYDQLPDLALLCHTQVRHALDFPTLWQGPHPTRGFTAWLQIEECVRCGTTREQWQQINSRLIIPIGQFKYWHPDNYLIEGGNNTTEAKLELRARAIARQNLVVDAEGHVVGNGKVLPMPERGRPNLRSKKKTKVPALSESG